MEPARTMRKISIGFGNLVDADLATVESATDVAGRRYASGAAPRPCSP